MSTQENTLINLPKAHLPVLLFSTLSHIEPNFLISLHFGMLYSHSSEALFIFIYICKGCSVQNLVKWPSFPCANIDRSSINCRPFVLAKDHIRICNQISLACIKAMNALSTILHAQLLTSSMVTNPTTWHSIAWTNFQTIFLFYIHVFTLQLLYWIVFMLCLLASYQNELE